MKDRSEQAYKTVGVDSTASDHLNTSAAELDIITTAGENLWLDQGFNWLVRGFAFCTVAVLFWMTWVIFKNALPAIEKFGLGFLWSQDWDVATLTFGALPYIYGTLLSSTIALLIAVPVGLAVALVTSEDLLPPWVRSPIAFFVELIAAIPSVIVGLWGFFVLIPFLMPIEQWLNLHLGWIPLFSTQPSGYGMLPAGIILAIMILPTMAAISREVFLALPKDLRSGSMSLGATRWETIFGVLLSAAASGILGAAILALGRALGETMAVTMVIGNSPLISASLLDVGYTIPAVLANEFGEALESLHIGALMYLSLILFIVTLGINIAAVMLVRLISLQSGSIKNLPAPLQTLIRPMLMLSLALHGFLLFIPLSSKSKDTPTTQEKRVRITQLPASAPKQPATRTSPIPSPKVAQTPQQVRMTPPTTRQLVVPSPRPQTVTSPKPVQTASPKPTPTPSPSPSAAAPSPTPATSSDPFADFPHYQPNTPGCFGLASCYKTGVALGNVSKYFDQQLPAKYKVEPGPTEPGRKVYQLSKGGKTQFLSLIFTDEQDGTVYVLADAPRSVDDLKQAVEVPSGLYDLFGSINAEAADEAQFADTSKFFTNVSSQDEQGSVIIGDLRPGIDTTKLVTGQSPEEVYTSLAPKLQQIFEQVSPGVAYGGGPVYELKQGSFTGYLNLVPNKDNTGTIIILWTSQPQ